MTFVSYAQNFEDVMLWRALKHVEKGFYIDVGANDPTIDSVTLAFYERGWRGINIEPMRQYFDMLCEKRPEDINLPVAVSDSRGELTFFDIPDTGLSTIDAAIAQTHAAAGRTIVEQAIPVTTLSDICAEHVHGPIHFLKIDVEGLEGAVLRGMDFQKWRPWILVIEATRPQSQVTNHAEWERMVLDAKYRFAYFDGLNHYYVASEHEDLMAAFKAPPNVFDNFNLRVGHAFSYPPTEFLVRIKDAELNAYYADVRTQRAHAQRDDLQVKLHEADEKLRTAVREAEEQIHLQSIRTMQAEASEAHMKAELQRIYASTSWKFSAPVRWLGRAVQCSKAGARLAFASPRAFAKRVVLGMARRAVSLAKGSPLLIKVAFMVRARYPNVWHRLMSRIKPAMVLNSLNASQPVAPVPPSAWTNYAKTSPFETMLTQELQRRQHKKNGY
jgi:FkbM family methyltransferase